ncbi:MAG: hypothetical protein IPN71_22560 [Fibrobacteres bacterium]|nr:hypothetical protein [Fibrobacterota bacterium]
MIPVHPIAASLLLLIAGLAQAQTSPPPPQVVVPRDVYRLVNVPDSARLSFTVLHTKGRNWLQTQIEQVGSCQQIFVDSVRVLDTANATGDILEGFEGLAPRRSVVVHWQLAQKEGDSRCTNVTASRYLRELPSPRKRPYSDTLLNSWAPGKILARGPNARLDSLHALMVDQAGDLEPRACPAQDCQIACIHPDSAARSAFLVHLRERIAQGLPVVRIGRGGAPFRVPASIDDTAMVDGLGLMTKWKAGNQVWGEDQPIRSVRSWGPTAPAQWLKTTYRRFYRWQGDTLAGGISALGATVEVSNDSTFECWSPYLPDLFDRDMTQELSNDWLIAPDTAELRDGRLRTTFQRSICGFRERSWEIHGDSITVGCTRVALSDLEQTLGTAPRQRPSKLLIMANATGLRIQPGLATGTPWAVAVRDASGRVLTRRDSREFEETISLSARGILVVEIRSGAGTIRRMVAR